MKIPGIIFTSMIFISACTAPTPTALSPTSSPISTSTDALPPTAAATLTSVPTPTEALHLEPFGKVKIDEAEIEFNVDGSGDNVDSIAFWEAPDPTESLMIVTSKGNDSVEVYQYPFTSELTTIACGPASNGVWVDQDRDILYITERESSNVCAFDLPSLERNESLSFSTAATVENSDEPNLTLLVLPDGQRRIYVSYDNKVFYHDAETGESLGEFEPEEGLETMYADPFYQVLYIPDESEQTGVYMYDPAGSPAGASFDGGSIFEEDAEGIWLYTCPSSGTSDSGEGLIVVSDQRDEITDFEFFNRRTKEHLGTLNISGVDNTDGISITQQASPEYPLGLLAVIGDDTTTVGVGWDTLLKKTGLSCG